MVPLSSPPSVSSPPLLHQNTIFKIDLPLTVYVKTTTLCGVFWSSEFSWKHEESLGSSFPAAAPFEAGCGDLVIAGDDTIFIATPGLREQKRIEERLRPYEKRR